MASPGYSYSERSGIQFTKGAGRRSLFIGIGSALTANEVTNVPRTADIPTLVGQGPVAEALALTNALEGQHGPHYVIRPTTGVAASWGAITKDVGSGPTITFTASVPYDRYQWKWETQVTGALGVGRGRYTLDNGYTWTPTMTIPSGGTYLMPNTNTTLTFPAGTYTLGDLYSGASTEPYFSTTNLGTAITAALADTDKDWDNIFLIGAPVDAPAGAAMYTALSTQLSTLVTNYRYNGGIVDMGIDTTADVITEMSALTSARVLPLYGSARFFSAKGFAGFGRPLQSATIPVSARAAWALVSESLGRVESGQLAGVTHVSYDEFVSGELNDSRIATLRSFPGNDPPGFYVNYDHIKGPVGSDVIIWPMRGVADKAAKIVKTVMLRKILENFPTKDDGTILDAAANSLEEEINKVLRAELKGKKDRSGKNNHVSDIFCQVDRSNIYATDRTINVTTLIRANQPAEQITHTLAFTAGSVTGETTNEEPTEPEE